MSNRSRVLRQEWVPTLFAAALAAPCWIASLLVAPHVAWAQSFFDGWLSVFSGVTFVGALILTVIAAARSFSAIEFMLRD